MSPATCEVARKPVVQADDRYNPRILEMRREQAEAIDAYLAGESVLAEYHEGKFGCAIMNDRRMLFLKDSWEPVGAGLWMDWREEHWDITKTQYECLPREERAMLEAREQVQQWISLEFHQEWLDTYAPAISDSNWWDGGWAKLSLEERERLAKPLAEKIRFGKRGI